MQTTLAKRAHSNRPAGRKPARIGAAEEVWIATALLHREYPRRQDFTMEEIVGRAAKEQVTGKLRPSVYANAVQHCVAQKPPSPSRLRYLVETRDGHRKLMRPGYGWHFGRDTGRKHPATEDLPVKYHFLLEWYQKEYVTRTSKRDSILELCGLGKEIWKGVNPDEYVRQLREE